MYFSVSLYITALCQASTANHVYDGCIAGETGHWLRRQNYFQSINTNGCQVEIERTVEMKILCKNRHSEQHIV